jgi:hypothetical protein
MRPLDVASDSGRYFRTFSTVTDGHVAKCPFWISLSQVSVTGLKQHACKYVIVSWMDFCSYTLWAECSRPISSGISGSRGTRHRLDYLSRSPVNIADSPFMTVTFIALNVTAQPLSHIWPTDISECWANPGRICAILAACGKEGILNVAVCVDAMMAPLGIRTSKGLSAIILFVHLALANRKCAVHPESKRAADFDGWDGVKFI